jgi:DMSO/TMAO reductase YedYZ heme-binding membrane subunit
VTSSARNWTVFLAATVVSSLAFAAYLAAVGVSDENVLTVLRWSARISFLLLMLVFVARPMQQLLKKPWTARLLRNRRLVGIAFAGIHTAHLGFIFFRGRVSDEFDFTPTENLPGALVYLVILVMLITSWNSTARRIGQRNWKILHTVGLYILFIAFTVQIRPASPDSATPINWLLLGIAIAALLVRLVAYVCRRPRQQLKNRGDG